MKNKPITLAAFLFSVLLFSCSKKDDTPKPPPPPGPPVILPDTLTTGWSKQSVSKTVLYDIFFQNNAVGYAVGATLFKTTDGGITWDSVAKTEFATNIAVTPNGNVFYVQENGIFKSTDGGKSFQASNSPSISDLYFKGNDTGYAVSKLGNFLRTVDGGANWIKLSSVPLSTTGSYASVYFINAVKGWVTLGSSVYKINADGISWTKAVMTGSNSNQESASIFAPSQSVVYSATSSNGEIYKSTDGGLNFSLIKKLTGTGYLDIHFINNEIGYACYYHRIYKTTDGGVSWSVVVALGNTELVELHFTDASHGWACGRDGSILRYNP